MSERRDHRDGDELVEEAAEHAERATQEREEMARKASLAVSPTKMKKRPNLRARPRLTAKPPRTRRPRSSDDAHDAG